MPKQQSRTSYLCRSCGSRSIKWAGRCPSCGEWGTLEETSGAPASHLLGGAPEPQELSRISARDYHRLKLPFEEINRVLGGGIVPGSLVLLGGDPGIGKSTLLLQIADAVARDGGSVAYVSGEESAHQLWLRAQRLGVTGENLFILPETDLDRVLQRLDQLQPKLVGVDSIQTMYLEGVESGAGSLVQVRDCALRLMRWAKEKSAVPVFITGHVTKEGMVAGPRTLEHMVDVVAYLEGEALGSYRVLRCTKNRFGSTNEIAVLEMREQGLVEVPNPSQVFLSGRSGEAVGSAVASTLEGTRPLLVEIQALVHPTMYGTPRRTTNGLDFNRLILICAVLSRQAGLPLATHDVIANVAGGLKLQEPAVDLALAMAIASSYHDRPIREGMVLVGEVGLSGELRPAAAPERRIAEASRLGFSQMLVPAKTNLADGGLIPGMEILKASTVREAIRLALVQVPHRAPKVGTSQ